MMTGRTDMIEIGKSIKLKLSERYYHFNRQFAVRDVFDAIVELVTNADDSYHRLFKKGEIEKDGGPILLECMEHRRGASSWIRIRDRAEGMTLPEMMTKFGEVGNRTSTEGDRGFMARGARDCTQLGGLLVESIKDDKYFACKITPALELIPLSDGKSAFNTFGKRKELGITRGNGTSVTLEILSQYKMPRLNRIITELPWHYALRDMLSEKSPTRLQVSNANNPSDPLQRCVFHAPNADTIIDHFEYSISQYPDAKAYLTIMKATEPFETNVDRRFRRSGFIVKGDRAIHDCTFLLPEFENNPYAARYFGRIDCPYIDKLLEEYDEYLKQGVSFPKSNPILLIDPNRQTGLIREHPFTSALFQFPSEKLRVLISKDKESDQKIRREIANSETKRRLSRLARAATLFMKQQLEDINEVSTYEDVDSSAYVERGLVIVPTYARISLGSDKKFWLYVKNDLSINETFEARITTSNESIKVLDPVIKLTRNQKREDRLVGVFRVHAEDVTDGTIIQAEIPGLPKAEAIIEVTGSILESRDFSDLLEFEHASYKVREGSNRTIRLYALSPELVSDPATVKIWTTNGDGIVVKESANIVPVSNSNFARAEVIVRGRRLNSTTTLMAMVNGRQASTKVKVIQKEEMGVPLNFDLRDEDFNNFRAIWADHENCPNLLLVSAKHPSVSRYLGPGPDFEGQNSQLFRLLLAEIIAESVCRKVMRLDTKQHPWDYRLADLKDDDIIFDTVLARLHGRIRDFVAEAHSVMVDNDELKQIL